jgi:hypothetical protein
MEEKNKQLPELRPEDLPLQEIEKRTLMFPKILELAVKNTQSSDWVDFGGNPWLDTPGAERIARVFGFTVKETRFEKLDRQDRDGPYYIYIWYGKVGLNKNDLWIDAIGACSSKKPFHSIEHGKRKHIEDINEMNILKDAYSNLVENGVTRFLGLRGLDWETLEKAGIDRKKTAKVEFKTKGEARKTNPDRKNPEPTVQPTVQEGKVPNPPGMPNPQPPGSQTQPEVKTLHTPPPSKPTGTRAIVDPRTRSSLIDYLVTRVLANRDQVTKEIEENFTAKQCNYILTNVAKLQGDLKLETLQDIVRGAMYGSS